MSHRTALFALATALLPAQTIDFVRDVQPILRTRCTGCHGGAQQMSGLRLDGRDAVIKGGYSGPAVKPGDAAQSLLIHRVTAANGLSIMPPAGPALTTAQVETLRLWIGQGASGPSAPVLETAAPRSNHWAFQPVTKPALPKVSNEAWIRTPVDRFILARLEKERIAPSGEADRARLLRRASLDLTGLPPTPAEIRDFLADTSAEAYPRAVERLLSSPHFGERWARPWLDRARYADSDGYEKDWMRPHAWRYRQWVIDAFNRDMPFDRFTVEQIAGDLLPNATNEQRVATGFHRQTLTNREGGISNKQFQFEAAIDRTSTVSATWLGLTAGCAQCHDHKFDPITQKDFYALFAFFDPMEESDIDAPMPGEMGPYLRKRDEYQSRRQALLAEYKVMDLMPEWERRMQEARDTPGKWTDWDLAWDCLLKLTDGGDGEKIIAIAPARRTPRQQDILIDHFVKNYHFAVGQKRYGEVKFKELDQKLLQLRQTYPQLSQAMAVEDGPARATHLRVRGDYRSPGIEVAAATPAFLPAARAAGARANRLDLANWIASPRNPLTARVAVNWIWAEIFGRGLVRTAEDFGTRGDAPTHPELLDHLAARFVEEGWSVKSAIRTIVLSNTYRQSSSARPDLNTMDPGNTLLARQSRLRLPAELIRDSALRAAGLLSPQVGGKSFYPPQPAGLSDLQYGKNWGIAWPESQGSERYRRGLYIHFQRSTPYPMLMNFDAPKGNVALCRRERSNNALQALNLLNDPAFGEAAEALAYQALLEAGTFEARLDAALWRVLGRPASKREAAKFQAFLATQRAVFEADGEAAKTIAPAALDGVPRSEIAAWVTLASVLLNLDEFITRE
ncbi:MAG: DUF1549 domain-containing protein [Acidobacteria bacterium]|nr:DUF1549 domain-containing protein [Acidobacteriota bacterium]